MGKIRKAAAKQEGSRSESVHKGIECYCMFPAAIWFSMELVVYTPMDEDQLTWSQCAAVTVVVGLICVDS